MSEIIRRIVGAPVPNAIEKRRNRKERLSTGNRLFLPAFERTREALPSAALALEPDRTLVYLELAPRALVIHPPGPIQSTARAQRRSTSDAISLSRFSTECEGGR